MLSGGKLPHSAGSMGSLIYSQEFSQVKEDFDDGYIRLWFDDRMVAQIEVSRNHVSGYRVETWIFGEKGQIHVGRFEQKPLEVVVETYGPDKPIDRKAFHMRDYGRPVPEFVDRFGPAGRTHRVLKRRASPCSRHSGSAVLRSCTRRST